MCRSASVWYFLFSRHWCILKIPSCSLFQASSYGAPRFFTLRPTGRCFFFQKKKQKHANCQCFDFTWYTSHHPSVILHRRSTLVFHSFAGRRKLNLCPLLWLFSTLRFQHFKVLSIFPLTHWYGSNAYGMTQSKQERKLLSWSKIERFVLFNSFTLWNNSALVIQRYITHRLEHYIFNE